MSQAEISHDAPRMLVVEDDPRSRKLLEGFLRSQRYAVRSAGDGPTALTLVEQEVPDVVLLDVMMPRMTGHEVCRLLKENPRTRLCQVMLVTALATNADKVQGLDTGADDYVTKPVRRDEFLAKVRALLRARRLLLELESARAALAARNEELQLKKTLAQTLVHDLKNPLTAVMGNLDLLRMRRGEAQSGELALIERSRHGADRMLKMILNLLDVEGLEEGRLSPQLQSVDAVAVVGRAIEEAESTAALQNTDLRAELPETAWVSADPSLLPRVLDNLIVNAISHSPQGAQVTVGVEQRAEGILISVRDAGPGIPEGLREQIFEKYAQGAVRKSGNSTNRGLGLTFCRLAVEAQGGTIWVDSVPGGGSVFQTLLPDAVPLPQASTSTATADA